MAARSRRGGHGPSQVGQAAAVGSAGRGDGSGGGDKPSSSGAGSGGGEVAVARSRWGGGGGGPGPGGEAAAARRQQQAWPPGTLMNWNGFIEEQRRWLQKRVKQTTKPLHWPEEDQLSPSPSPL
ncbi:translation initiation factor IF-2-like [Hemicordylus capensis]|uniref:translation initiation factor IF-2-like n=1 Tax=Hemicordylus capensis TaxID=884348 RepID=UPI002303FA1D|nr:translation initiation factor IF-2-like [Hemicordylus capensis]